MLLVFAALSAFLAIFITNAWVVDDAYITFRTCYNVVHGYGLTWNPAERVQVYTHPLWMFLVTGVYAITREVFFTSLALSLVVCAAALLVLRSVLAGWGQWATGIALLLGSKAFMDYTSSGLENALSYLLGAAFLALLLRAGPPDERRLAGLIALAALAFVNRVDTLLLYLPACLLAVWQARPRVPRARLAAALVLGGLPLLVWVGFSVLYYGFPFPNTFYAKSGSTGLPQEVILTAGLRYFANSLAWDPVTLVVTALGSGAALVWGSSRLRAVAAGVALYLLYVLWAGGAGTHMSGRFFSVTYLIAVVLLLQCLSRQWGPPVLAGLVLVAMALSPTAPWKANTRFYRPPGPTHDGTGPHGIADVRHLATREGAGLLTLTRGAPIPNHAWYREGLAFRRSPETVRIGGGGSGLPIGYFGFAAGPQKFIIDTLALSDPLLSHLPVDPGSWWGPGHFPRAVPAGYEASVREDRNLIVSPPVHALYDQIRLLTRGPLFARGRLEALWALNLPRRRRP